METFDGFVRNVIGWLLMVGGGFLVFFGTFLPAGIAFDNLDPDLTIRRALGLLLFGAAQLYIGQRFRQGHHWAYYGALAFCVFWLFLDLIIPSEMPPGTKPRFPVKPNVVIAAVCLLFLLLRYRGLSGSRSKPS